MTTEFRQRFIDLARRSVAAAPRCANEESAKMFLVLPMVSLLGYDYANPAEVFPEHHCDFSDKYKNRVDFAILQNDKPVIAIECKPVGSAMKDDRGQLRSYFNAARSVKMGVLTDGIVWEFYADSDEPNMMDEHAFLSFDLREVAKEKVHDSVVAALLALSKANFDPENIGAEAKRKHVFNSVVQYIAEQYSSPNEALPGPCYRAQVYPAFRKGSSRTTGRSSRWLFTNSSISRFCNGWTCQKSSSQASHLCRRQHRPRNLRPPSLTSASSPPRESYGSLIG